MLMCILMIVTSKINAFKNFFLHSTTFTWRGPFKKIAFEGNNSLAFFPDFSSLYSSRTNIAEEEKRRLTSLTKV